jgi:signal transduction histidine kinase
MSILSNAGAGLLLLEAGKGNGGTAQLREIFGDVQDRALFAADIIKRLRAFLRKRPLELRTLDVNEVASDMLRLVAGDARRRSVAVCAELAPGLPAVAADRVCLQQVVLNLIVNAMDAMDEVAAEERRVTVRTRRQAHAVEVAVSDTGSGIRADRLPKLFDAFFTTKAEGIGLGLAIARSIAEAHGGQISAEDHGGRGATFRLTLPMQATA